MKRGKTSERKFQIRLSEKELEEFNRAYEKTPYRSKSEYTRKMLLGKPVTIFYRNQSLDDLTEWVIRLRKDFKNLLTMETVTADEREALVQNVHQIIEQLVEIIGQCSPK